VAGTIYMNFNIEAQPIYLIAGAVGALLPDIDEPKSYLGNKTKSTSFFINIFFGHRGITHSILALLILQPLLLLFFMINNINLDILYFFNSGYLSHLLTDLFTKGGIPLLYPNEKRYKIPVFKTGGFLERIFRYVLYYMFFGFIKF
jgi:inner membrane protein